MYKQGVKLNNDDGSFRCYITQGEAQRGVKNGSMRRIRVANSPAPLFQLIKIPVPSNSRESSTSICERDTRLLIGLQRIGSPRDEKHVDEAEKSLERLIGFGLLPVNASLPMSGYL